MPTRNPGIRRLLRAVPQLAVLLAGAGGPWARWGAARGDVDILPALKGRGFQLRDPEGSVLRFTVHRPGHRRASPRSPGVSRRDVSRCIHDGVRGVAAGPADEARLALARLRLRVH